jgi:hypothetical protein
MLLFADSYDGYATADRTKKWTASYPGAGSGTITIGAFGRRSTQGLRLHAAPNSSNSGNLLKQSLPVTGNTAIVGMSFKYTGTNTVYYWRESPMVLGILRISTIQCSLRLQPHTGLLDLIRGTGGAEVLLGTTSSGLTANAFNSVELKVVVATGTGGSAEVRINNVTVLTVTGVNTANGGISTWDGIQLGGAFSQAGSGGATLQMDYDDLYICDGSGPAPLNDFLGDLKVDAFIATGPGAMSQWTPSAGLNWQTIDEVPPNDDTDYNEAPGAAGAVDTFPMPDASAGALIYAVQSNFTCKKLDAGTLNLAAAVRQGGVNYVGPTLIGLTTYSIVLSMLVTNPATGLPWTEAEFNAAEFGYAKV